MPSAQLAASANGVLERSSQDSSLFRAHKPLSRNGDILRLPGAFPQTTAWNDDSCTDFSDDSTPIGSPLQNGPESGLPPTPPSHETQRPPSAVDVTDGVVAKRPSLRTPINQRSPPTPEPSPLRRPEYPQTKLQPPPTLRYPSSRAESFTTAKSHLGSDDDVSLGSYYDALTPVQQIVIKANQTQDMSFGLGLHLEAGDDVTPTERNPFGRSSNNTWETSNGGALKNGTVRSLASRPPHSISVTKRGQNPREHEGGKRLSKSPGLEKFAREIGWTSDALGDTIADSKRLSSTSTTSTVVEAVVVSTPTHQKRQLRHAGKNLAFRHTSDTTADRPSPRRSHRMPVNGVDHTHRLLHHYDRIPDRKWDSLGSALPTEAVSRHDTISTNSSTAKVRALDDVVKNDKQSKLGADENGSPGYFDVPKRRLKRAANGDSPISKQSEAPQDRRIFTAPAIVNLHNQRITLQYSPKEHPHESFRRSYEGFRRISDDASDRSLLSTPSPDNSRFVPSPPASKAARKLLQEQATDAVEPLPQPGLTEFLTLDRAKKAESIKSRASDRTEEIRRPSMDHERTSPVFLHTGHTSFDRATMYASRYRDASRTPYSQHSQVSGVSDGLEVHEATAMAIYPHNNNSLVVVQQVARDGSLPSSGNQTFTTAGPSMSQANLVGNSLAPPALVFNDKPLPIPKEEPPTPPILMFNDKPLPTPGKFDDEDDDDDDDDDTLNFALETPRTPPLPPALNVIPPTPNNDNESDSKDSDRPSRRQSLTKKARRYSDSLIQPVLERTATITKRMNITLPQRRQSLLGKDVLEKHNTLHPFWRPRGFWDDFSSDSDEDYENIDAMSIGRLPKGGDTSNVGAEETQRQRIAALGRRLTNGFKGSGGFLIGNSLSVERAGSNASRHHIQLPSVPMADVRAGLRSGLVKTSTGLGRAKATTLERAGVLARRIGRFEGRIMKQRSQATLRHNVHQPDNTAVTSITSTTSPPPQPPNNDHDAALVDAADHRPTVITTITTSSPNAKATPTLRTKSSVDLALSGGADGVSRFSTASTSATTAGPVQTDEVDIEQQYEDFRRAREQARQKWHAYHDRKNKFKDPERGRSTVATEPSTSDTAGGTTANDTAPGGTRRRRSLSLPGTRWGVEYVGLTGLREKLAKARSERRRDRLRGSIRVRPVEREVSRSSYGGRESLGWGSVWGAGGGAAGGTSATR